MFFKKRRIEAEILDDLPPEIARPNLADLIRINRNFGGRSVLEKTLRLVAGPQHAFTILDVGAASGDAAAFIRELYPLSRVTSLDLHWTNLERAPQPKLIADAFALPFAEASFDYVLCSLFLHHFADEESAKLLSGFYTVARKALLVCDLERNILPYLFLPATKWLFRWNDVTVSDGMKSVRAAFRAPELKKIASRAGIPAPDVRAYRPAFRLVLTGKKEEQTL
ncbi:MAG TPA: methyltransferase domain-containing protein [Bryobacteraceae bacterium]